MATTSPAPAPGTAPGRILSLDLIRGIAVMGIFSVNVVGMAMVFEAYFYPPDYGFGGLGDRIMWAANFVIVDGKFRSLFSMLFGASMVLVCERAIAAGTPAWRVHYPRMLVLLAFGYAHYTLLWWGDILVNYALVGMFAFALWRLTPGQLLLAAALVLGHYYAVGLDYGLRTADAWEALSGAGAGPAQRAEWAGIEASMRPSPQALAEAEAAHASIPAHLAASTGGGAWKRPFEWTLFGYGSETLGLMLLGMGLYKSGFLTGARSRRVYLWTAGGLVLAGLAWFGHGAWRVLAADFDRAVFLRWGRVGVEPFAPLMAVGYAALIILAVPQRGAIAERLAAVGRTAFTNYLGSTLIGFVLFFETGFGLFGEVSRGQAWLFVPLVWAAMLLWSKPWLERFRYGPFEWLWRCLSRGRWERLRRAAPAGRGV